MCMGELFNVKHGGGFSPRVCTAFTHCRFAPFVLLSESFACTSQYSSLKLPWGGFQSASRKIRGNRGNVEGFKTLWVKVVEFGENWAGTFSGGFRAAWRFWHQEQLCISHRLWNDIYPVSFTGLLQMLFWFSRNFVSVFVGSSVRIFLELKISDDFHQDFHPDNFWHLSVRTASASLDFHQHTGRRCHFIWPAFLASLWHSAWDLLPSQEAANSKEVVEQWGLEQ